MEALLGKRKKQKTQQMHHQQMLTLRNGRGSRDAVGDTVRRCRTVPHDRNGNFYFVGGDDADDMDNDMDMDSVLVGAPSQLRRVLVPDEEGMSTAATTAGGTCTS